MDGLHMSRAKTNIHMPSMPDNPTTAVWSRIWYVLEAWEQRSTGLAERLLAPAEAKRELGDAGAAPESEAKRAKLSSAATPCAVPALHCSLYETHFRIASQLR